MVLCGYEEPESEDVDDVTDRNASRLSYIGKAAYNEMRTKHKKKWHKAWNVTSGKVIGEVMQTPQTKFSWLYPGDPPAGHGDWFPAKFFEVMSKTQVWCDVTSLSPPDGDFMTKFKEALKCIAKTAEGKEDPIIVRLLFGNIIGMPVDCHSVLDELVTELMSGIDSHANIQLWVGAWRKGVSWNHSKIIAVDGKYLITGGHNLWTRHYLRSDPVHDLTVYVEGKVAHDGHLYANEQWRFIEQQRTTFLGKIIAALPDRVPTILQTRVTVAEWGLDADEFPPAYSKDLVPTYERQPGEVPILSMGRFGSLSAPHPSDDAIVAMFDAAQSSIRMALQDLGPICLPGLPGPIAVPGCKWPKAYMEALGRAIWEREVEVEIALSNPGSVPDGLHPTEALYGNGWNTAEVAAEIIRTIPDQYEDVDESELRRKIETHLRICYIKQAKERHWNSGMTMGMHSKHFLIDDRCCYIGSQNLYIADLAEWGVVIDDEAQTKKIMQEYWAPLWDASHTENDFLQAQEVFAAMDVDRDGEDPRHADEETKALMQQAMRANHRIPDDSAHHYDD
eukprot:TRINITY_DN7376_c0_g3_i1.p1 TRINITY_DN7376_c0_g3~~TRINITY_DN7376_c0_g3_i1.p1  ORF type:complete len:562 (+),score=97.37 TRINITY_DN7376_c0_g3_i1:136-1821(+)